MGACVRDSPASAASHGEEEALRPDVGDQVSLLLVARLDAYNVCHGDERGSENV